MIHKDCPGKVWIMTPQATENIAALMRPLTDKEMKEMGERCRARPKEEQEEYYDKLAAVLVHIAGERGGKE